MLNEKTLTKAELDKREDIIMKMKKNKRSLVDKYGKDAEAVMYGRATNMAKKQSESMKSDRLNELIKDSLTNPKAVDLDKQDSKQEDLVALVRELDPNEYEVYALDAEVDPEDADQMMDWIYSLTDSEVEVEIKKLEGVNEDKLAAIKEDLKETLDDDVWAKVDSIKNNLRGDELIDVIVRAMSTDDANLYLDAIMRDYDIDIELPYDKMDPISGNYGIKDGDDYEDEDGISHSSGTYGGKKLEEYEVSYLAVIDKSTGEEVMRMDRRRGGDEVTQMQKWIDRSLRWHEDMEKERLDNYKELFKDNPEDMKFEPMPAPEYVMKGGKYSRSMEEGKPLGEASDEKIDKEEKKKGPTAKQLKDILDRIKLLNPKAKLGPLQKLVKIGDIKETIKQMRSINEKDYPFDKCLDDNEGKYGKKGAAKVCGSIRAAFGEGKINENVSETEYFSYLNDLRDSGKTNMFGAGAYLQKDFGLDKREAREILARWMKSFGENIEEGLPKGYFKKEFGIGKKKKIKEATGPATIEDTEKAAGKVVAAIRLEEPDSKVEISFGLEEGSFDVDLNDQPHDGGSYTVDSDGDITLVSIRKPGFVGNLNDAPSTIQSTINDVLAA